MPEYYKKVVCRQFVVTPDEKEAIANRQAVSFEGQAVRQSAGGRYHILFPVGDRLIPVHESDWIIRNPEIEIKRDHEFRSQYITFDNIDPVAIEHRLNEIRAQSQNSI